MDNDKKKEAQSFRDQYNITVNGDYQNFPEVKSITYSNTYYYGSAAQPRSEQVSLTEAQQTLFDKAVEAGLMAKTEQGYEWKMEQSLLEYFCGRVFCGDKPSADNRRGTTAWEKTTQDELPSKLLNQLFGTTTIGQYRNKRQGLQVPVKHELVDELF